MTRKARGRLRTARTVRTAIAGLIAAALLAAIVANASATIILQPNGVRASYLPSDPGTAPALRVASEPVAPLEYHGGPVMPSNTNTLIFWSPPGSPEFPAGFRNGVKRYFKDLAHDSALSGTASHQNVDSIAGQYSDSEGNLANYDSKYGRVIIDRRPLPPNGCTAAPICLSGEQIESEIFHTVVSRHLPHDLSHEYFLFTAPGVESCFYPEEGYVCSANVSNYFYRAYCAYHSYMPLGAPAPGGPIVFANEPYVYGEICDETAHHPNGPSDSALLGGLSHEHNESITDPQLNAWYDRNGEENGDKCRTFSPLSEWGESLGSAPDGAPYNQIINGHLYFYQQEFSNIGNECRQRL